MTQSLHPRRDAKLGPKVGHVEIALYYVVVVAVILLFFLLPYVAGERIEATGATLTWSGSIALLSAAMSLLAALFVPLTATRRGGEMTAHPMEGIGIVGSLMGAGALIQFVLFSTPAAV